MTRDEVLAMLDCQIADREDRARRYIRKAGKERKRRGVPQTTAERMSEYHCHRLDELKQLRAWVVENFPRAAVDEAMVEGWRERLRGRVGPFTADVRERWVDADIARMVIDEAIAALNPERGHG